MNASQIFYVSIVLGLVSFGLVAKWYVAPWARRISREQALTPFLLFHSFRYIGLAFLVPGVVATDLAQQFAAPAGYGDLLAALLALGAAVAIRFRQALGVPLVWIFNVVGTLDLLNAFFQANRNEVGPSDLQAMYFIPTVVVPALFVTHGIIFWLLLRAPTNPETGVR